MKFNWGTGLAIGMGLFMIFILQYVIRVQMDSGLDNELVTEDYYQQEVEVDGKYDREVNSKSLVHPVVITSDMNQGISIDFPEEFEYSKIKGKVSLYRPSNQKLDFEIPISLSSSNLLIPNKDLVGGRWDIAVEWSYNGVHYRNSEILNLK